jgi:ceramide glucosyltransferase
MIWLAWGIALAAISYQLLAIIALLRFRRRPAVSSFHPPLSILKPIAGLDYGFRAAIESHMQLQYQGEYEVLFGVHDRNDPAVAEIQRLIERYPRHHIRLIENTTIARNAKVGTLCDLAGAARFDHLLVNDSDIQVEPDYLAHALAPLADPRCGISTCVYRAEAASWSGRWEAFGIAVDFTPSALVAPLVGVREFGLGATLAFRRADLEAIGGFPAIADYLADDYQLARKITATGKYAHIAAAVVETHLGEDSLRETWRHQLRWSRTIRFSRGDGFAGLPLTHAGLWALLLAALGLLLPAVLVSGARVVMALLANRVLRGGFSPFVCLLAPLWDCWAFAVWLAALSGNTVEWRGGRMQLYPDGRIAAAPAQESR